MNENAAPTNVGAECLDLLEKHGATVVWEAGEPRIRGRKLPDEVVVLVKQNRDAVLQEACRRRTVDADRWGKMPPKDAPQLGRRRDLSRDQAGMLVDYVQMQGRDVQTWTDMRGSQYYKEGHPPIESDWWACLDCLCWQRQCEPGEALAWLNGTHPPSNDRGEP